MALKIIGSVNLGFAAGCAQLYLSAVHGRCDRHGACPPVIDRFRQGPQWNLGVGETEMNSPRCNRQSLCSTDHSWDHLLGARKATSTTADFYAADSRLTRAQNGFCAARRLVVCAAAFLGVTGLTALYVHGRAFFFSMRFWPLVRLLASVPVF